jgi:DNA-binding response OmpR family regulator
MKTYKILSLDDDFDFGLILKTKLKLPAYELTYTEKSSTLIELIKKGFADLVLLDLNLGENNPNGLEVLDQIKSIKKIPVIILSHSDDFEGIQKALDLGADDYVTKPLDEAILKSKMNHLLKPEDTDFETLHIARVPTSLSKIELQTDAIIKEITEYTITLSAPFFARKSSRVKLTGKLIEEVTKLPQVLLTVQSTVIFQDTYLTTLEFDPDNSTVLENIKQWLKAH